MLKSFFAHRSRFLVSPPSRVFSKAPLVFNPIHEFYVQAGKEKQVGLWLLGIAGSIYAMIVLGGYTRLSRSGLSMVKWKPRSQKPPRTPEEWESEFAQYKEYPEYKIVNPDMTVDGFKRIFYVEWLHRLVGNTLGVLFFAPMTYFWARGYLKPKMKVVSGFLFALGGMQGLIGWWMVKSGLVDKSQTTEVDKTPRVSPYRFSVHAFSAYFLYGVSLWYSLKLLTKPQENFITYKNIMHHNLLRKKLRGMTHIFALVFLTGFLAAGIGAGKSCNTFPFLPDSYFLTRKHLNRDIPLWQNFTENKLVVQVVHRTLAVIAVSFTAYSALRMRSLLLIPQARFALAAITAAVLGQMTIGITAVKLGVPLTVASLHQIGAVSVLTTLIIGLHFCRKLDPRHLRNILGKLRAEHPEQYSHFMKTQLDMQKAAKKV